MKTNVILSRQKRETQSIIIRISFGAYIDEEGKRRYRPIDFYTGKTVDVKNWDKKRGKVRNDSKLNAIIEKATARLTEIHRELIYKESLSYDNFKQELQTDEELNRILARSIKVNEGSSENVLPFEFIADRIDKSTVSVGTKKDHNNTLTHLKEFDIQRGKVFSWKGAGYDYYLELVEYLKNKNLRASTIDKIVKNLKVFLSWADLTDNLEVNQDFKKTLSGRSLFGKIDKSETEHIYLTEKEIQQITDANIEDEKLSEIRDLFVVGCWSGLRISDLSRLQRANINNNVITITAKKTSQTVVIPVTTELQKILDKYPDELPTIPTDQHFNREIKKVCELAGINEMVLQDVRKGSLQTVTPVAKHKLVTAHTARRSFATNLYRRGIPSTQLMMLTGHKTEDAFLKYIKVSKEDNARDVAEKLRNIS